MSQRLGLVLAGGLGKRLGAPKGSVVWDGRTLADRAARVLAPLTAGVLVSVAPGAVNPAPKWPAVEDAPPAGRGPLEGIRAGFAAAESADLLVLACDYPDVSGALLRAVVAAAGPEDDIVFPVDPRGRDHPLVALWRRSAVPTIEAALAGKVYKVRAVLAELRVRRVHPGERPELDFAAELRNVNEPADLPAPG